MPDIRERAVHLSFAFVLIFLGGNMRQRRQWIADLALTAAGIFLCMYAFFNYDGIMGQYGIPTGTSQVVMAFLLIALILEAARRAVRPALPLIALAALLYALLGHLIPGYFGHPPYTLSTLGGSYCQIWCMGHQAALLSDWSDTRIPSLKITPVMTSPRSS